MPQKYVRCFGCLEHNRRMNILFELFVEWQIIIPCGNKRYFVVQKLVHLSIFLKNIEQLFAFSKNMRYNRITGVEIRPALTSAVRNTATQSQASKEGKNMNYLAWSQEYLNTAAELAAVMAKLRKQSKGCGQTVKKEMEARIAQYRICYNECMRTAALLRERHRDAA